MITSILNIDSVKTIAAETIWPTRCAVCDKPGYILCPSCEAKLPFIDSNKICPKCGEPFGRIQCCGCNPIDKMLTEEQKVNYKPNYDNCISVFRLNQDTGRIIALNKDAGERRLSKVMAYFMFRATHPSWINNNSFITYIPSSKEAVLRRGFDHGYNLCNNVSKFLNQKFVHCFNRPVSKDQRTLNRAARISNLSGSLNIKPNTSHWIEKQNPSFIIVDDVYTTGSTLNSAAGVLKKSGAKNVFCLTFARTF